MATRPKSRGRRQAKRIRRVVKLPVEYFEAIDLGNLLFPSLYQFENGLRIVLDSPVVASALTRAGSRRADEFSQDAILRTFERHVAALLG